MVEKVAKRIILFIVFMKIMSWKNILKKYKFKKRKYSDNFMHNAIINDIKHYSLPMQLEYADNISMYYSLEARSPFLSKDILKFSNQLPDTYFFKKGYPKSILRDAMKPIMSKNYI